MTDFFKKTKHSNPRARTLHQKCGAGCRNVDFTDAADKTVHSVVHVKNVSYRTVSNPMMEFFYGYRGGQQQEQVGTGSGVIISEDGYIVTNNHVVRGRHRFRLHSTIKKHTKPNS
jgi:S1-C subfamily serine protease